MKLNELEKLDRFRFVDELDGPVWEYYCEMEGCTVIATNTLSGDQKEFWGTEEVIVVKGNKGQ